jgi:hypothetical protein
MSDGPTGLVPIARRLGSSLQMLDCMAVVLDEPARIAIVENKRDTTRQTATVVNEAVHSVDPVDHAPGIGQELLDVDHVLWGDPVERFLETPIEMVENVRDHGNCVELRGLSTIKVDTNSDR